MDTTERERGVHEVVHLHVIKSPPAVARAPQGLDFDAVAIGILIGFGLGLFLADKLYE